MSTASATSPPVSRSTGSGKGRAVRTGPLLAPSVGLLIIWMIIPLVMTLWFSFQRYNLVNEAISGFAGFANYKFLLTRWPLWSSIITTIIMVGSVLVLTIVFGVFFAVLFDQEFPGRNIARLLVIAPFFVMPTVSSLIWKNLLMNPVNGLFAWMMKTVGLEPIDFFGSIPLISIIIIIAWQWIPFATLILVTAMQSLDRDQMEAAKLDGAKGPAMFWFITLPHLLRPISIVVMIEMIFLLSIFAEIKVTTSGGPGIATTNLNYLIFDKGLLANDIGIASAGGVIAVILANIVAAILIRTVARNLDK